MLFGFAQSIASRSAPLQGERIATSRGSRPAPRNDMQKLAACSHCKDALPGQIRNRLRIRLKCCFFLAFSAGTRIATSRGSRPAPRNDMLKFASCPRNNSPVRNDMQSTCPCPHSTNALPEYCRKKQIAGKFRHGTSRQIFYFYISKGSMDSTGWPTLVRYSSSCSGSSVQTVSSAIMSVKFSTP